MQLETRTRCRCASPTGEHADRRLSRWPMLESGCRKPRAPSGSACGHDPRLELDRAGRCPDVRDRVPDRRPSIDRRGLIVVASSAPLSPLISQSAATSLCRRACRSHSASAELIEEAHRRENEARFGIARAQRERPDHGRRSATGIVLLPEPVDRAHPRLLTAERGGTERRSRSCCSQSDRGRLRPAAADAPPAARRAPGVRLHARPQRRTHALKLRDRRHRPCATTGAVRRHHARPARRRASARRSRSSLARQAFHEDQVTGARGPRPVLRAARRARAGPCTAREGDEHRRRLPRPR